MIKLFIRIVTVLLLAIGTICFMYCPVCNYTYNLTQDEKIKEYENTFKITPDKIEAQKKKDKNLKKLERDIRLYNKTIFYNKQRLLGNSSYEFQPALNLSDYGIDNEIYGYIINENIGIKMPIYLSATEYHMSLGAAHVSQTSIPYGGTNTNAVIAGHCGYGGSNYFRYIEKLKSGDEVELLTPLGKKIYTVKNKKTIEPTDLESIKIQKGKDLITLFTCHPYPTSRYRICVFCEAVN